MKKCWWEGNEGNIKKKVIDNIQLTHFATTPKSTFPWGLTNNETRQGHSPTTTAQEFEREIGECEREEVRVKENERKKRKLSARGGRKNFHHFLPSSSY